MRKLMYVIPILLLMVVFYSCMRSEEIPQESMHNQDIIMTKWYSRIGTGNSKGFYHIDVSESGAQNIKYFDYTTGKEMYLCSRRECLHNDDTCSSYLFTYGGEGFPFATEEYVFVFYGGAYGDTKQSFYDNYGDDSCAKVIRCGLDGDNRKVLYTFPPMVWPTGNKAVSRNTIFTVCEVYEAKQGKKPERTIHVYGINIDNGGITYDKEIECEKLELLSASEDRLYLTTEKLAPAEDYSSLSEQAKNSKRCILCLDTTTGEVSNIFESSYNNSILAYDESLYVINRLENCLEVYTVSEKNVDMEGRYAFSEKLTGCSAVCKDGLVLIFRIDGEVDQQFFDLSDKELHKGQISFTYPDKEGGYKTVDYIPRIAGETNERYLIIKEITLAKHGFFDSSGDVVVMEGESYTFDLVKKDKLYN